MKNNLLLIQMKPQNEKRMNGWKRFEKFEWWTKFVAAIAPLYLLSLLSPFSQKNPEKNRVMSSFVYNLFNCLSSSSVESATLKYTLMKYTIEFNPFTGCIGNVLLFFCIRILLWRFGTHDTTILSCQRILSENLLNCDILSNIGPKFCL